MSYKSKGNRLSLKVPTLAYVNDHGRIEVKEVAQVIDKRRETNQVISIGIVTMHTLGNVDNKWVHVSNVEKPVISSKNSHCF